MTNQRPHWKHILPDVYGMDYSPVCMKSHILLNRNELINLLLKVSSCYMKTEHREALIFS